MKKRIIYGILTVTTMLFAFSAIGFAETNASVTVTFTIPVMPGLNAPLIEENKLINSAPTATELNQVQQENLELQSSLPVNKETNEGKVENTTGGPFAVLKTIYSR